MTFEERLEEDADILKRMQYLEGSVDYSKITKQQAENIAIELTDLRQRYYVDNADIRLYWKQR